jgi:hypothetical protein
MPSSARRAIGAAHIGVTLRLLILIKICVCLFLYVYKEFLYEWETAA